DPVNLNCHLFINHNFNQSITFNLGEELASVPSGGEKLIKENGMYFKETRISSLFIEDLIIPSYPLLILFTIIAFLSTIIIYRYNTVRTKTWF
ncbi:MAG: hypothetical protein HWN81_23510, partial [Candidatus Lokiarchaeota archaeon]|nr:hypothetical protein [Candidatus Lokiarchaeota archaeon]